jgi:hypothetical protein
MIFRPIHTRTPSEHDRVLQNPEATEPHRGVWHVAAGGTERGQFHGDKLYIMGAPKSPNTVVRSAEMERRLSTKNGYSEGKVGMKLSSSRHSERPQNPCAEKRPWWLAHTSLCTSSSARSGGSPSLREYLGAIAYTALELSRTNRRKGGEQWRLRITERRRRNRTASESSGPACAGSGVAVMR